MEYPKLIALSIFLIAYLLFIIFPKKRMHIGIISSISIVLFGVISFKEAFFAVNWNVMGIFIGMLVVADVFMESRVPAYLAESIVNRAKNTCWSILFICVLTGFISAFVENVATVLIVAPIALSLARKLRLNPVNMMIAIAVTSNLQGAATLIGDPPSMLLAGFAKLNFMDFFFYQGKPSIFFAVEIGAIFSFIVLYFIFRHHKEKIMLVREEKVKSWVPSIILIALVILLAASSFFKSGSSYAPGVLCMIFAMIALIWQKFFQKTSAWDNIKSLDWDTSIFLVGVFILVGSITITGWVTTLSEFLAHLIGTNIFLGYTLLVFLSVALSAFIDNVPFLAAMLPIILPLSTKLGINPPLFLFGLLIGTSLGGNITPIGASANIVACGLLRKEGHPVKFKEFMKIGLPFTLVAVSVAYIFLWFVWGP